MLDWILDIDRAIFLFINKTLANPVTDALMPIITSDDVLRVLFGLILIALLITSRGRFVWIVVFSVLVVVLTDQCSSSWLKPAFERLRPCKTMDVHLLVGCGCGYSFPSSHATNLFGQAVFFGILYRKYLPYTLLFASLVGVSRIFVGVHYPVDIIAGAVVGSLLGGLMAYLLCKLFRVKKLKPEPVLFVVFKKRSIG